MISKDDDVYNDTGGDSYDPAEDEKSTCITEVHDDKDDPLTDPDNNVPIKEDVEPYPGVPGIIGYGNDNDAEAIPA